MIRKFVVLGLSVLLMAGAVYASELLDVVPIGKTDVQMKAVGPASIDAAETDIFQLYRSNASTYYLSSGAAGDTFAVYMKPVAPCSLHYVLQNWYSAGNVTAFLWEPGVEWLAAFPDGRADGATAARGTVSESPIGDVIFGPAAAASAGYGWQYLFDQDQMEQTAQVYRENAEGFMVGFAKSDALPQPLSSDVVPYCYTWFGGPWSLPYNDTTAYWGMYSSTDALDINTIVGVSYPVGAPPIILDITGVPFTVDGDRVSEVSCRIVDPVSGWTVDDTAWLVYEVVDGDDAQVSIDSVEITDDDSDEYFFGEIPALGASAGYTVYYWVTALDDEDNYSTTMGEAKYYVVMPTADPAATILWVDDGSYGGTASYGMLYTLWMNSGLAEWIEYWPATDYQGIDASVIDQNDWDAIIYSAHGSVGVPMVAADDNIFADYLAGGGNLFYSDADYFFVRDDIMEGGDNPNIFSSGDFAYDVFGISGGWNDPADDDGNAIADTQFVGVAGTPSEDFESEVFEIDITNFGNAAWGDYCYPVDAVNGPIFYGANDDEVYGVMNETAGGGTAILFTFDWTAATDFVYISATDFYQNSQQQQDLLYAILDVFGVSAPEQGGANALPGEYALNQNYPNPFNPSTQISFQVPQAGKVMVKVYNVQGQEVATLFNGNVSAGTQTLTFDASSLASGVYLYRMEAGDFVQTRKMALVK